MAADLVEERQAMRYGSCHWRRTKLIQHGGIWLGEIKKTRNLDQNFKELIEKDFVFTCERHFAAEDVKICKYSFSNSCNFRFYLHFDFALFTVWPFYKPATLLILMVFESQFASLFLLTVKSDKMTKKKPRFAALPMLNVPGKES